MTAASYRTEDGRAGIQCRFDEESLWLTRAQMAELSKISVPTVDEHRSNTFAEDALDKATIGKFRTVRRPTCTEYLQARASISRRHRTAARSISPVISERYPPERSPRRRVHCPSKMIQSVSFDIAHPPQRHNDEGGT